jgi:hypothetical protein
MARLYLTSANKMAQNLGRDMRQGPLACACHLGFNSTNYNNKCKKTTLQPFNQEVLQKFTYI